MKLRPILAFIGLFILLAIIILLVLASYNGIIPNYNLNNNSSTTMGSTKTVMPSISVDTNSSLTYPPNDYVINHINWSLYPNLQTGYVLVACISEPTDVIPYTFFEVQIVTEVKNTENKTIIKEQLAGVAIEAKKMYGPRSSINIIGTKDGIARWFASILPYEETVS